MAKDTQTEIEKFTKRLNEWRQGREGGDRRIPQAFWREAGLLAAAHGIGVVARAAGLNHMKVKARVPAKNSVVRESSVKKTTSPFVELPMPLPHPVNKVMVVEVRSGRGDFLRIENGSAADVATLVGALLRRA